MRSGLGFFSILLLLTPSCLSISCRTCKNEECFKKDVLVMACNKNTPILPFQVPSHKNKEHLQYGCLELEYSYGNSIDVLQQCIIAEDIMQFCTSIASSVNVIRCSVDLPTENRFKREISLDNTGTNHYDKVESTSYDITAATQSDDSDSMFATSTPNGEILTENTESTSVSGEDSGTSDFTSLKYISLLDSITSLSPDLTTTGVPNTSGPSTTSPIFDAEIKPHDPDEWLSDNVVTTPNNTPYQSNIIYLETTSNDVSTNSNDDLGDSDLDFKDSATTQLATLKDKLSTTTPKTQTVYEDSPTTKSSSRDESSDLTTSQEAYTPSVDLNTPKVDANLPTTQPDNSYSPDEQNTKKDSETNEPTTQITKSFNENIESKSTTLNSEILDEYGDSVSTSSDNPTSLDGLDSSGLGASTDFTTSIVDYLPANLNIPESEAHLPTILSTTINSGAVNGDKDDDLEGSGQGKSTDSSDVNPTPTRSPNSALTPRSSFNFSLLLITICILYLKLQ